MIKDMKIFILVSMLCFGLNVFAADCHSAMDGVLNSEGLGVKAAGVQRKNLDWDSKQIRSKREYYMSHAIYSYKKDPKYGDDIFSLGDDVDVFVDEKRDFTLIQEIAKAGTEVRVFDNAKEKKVQGFSWKKDKRQGVFKFNDDCSISEVMMIYEGSRCYVKKSECVEMAPISGAKLQKKCSYFNDFGDKTVNAFSKSCEFMAAAGSAGGGKSPTAEHKDKPAGVR